MDFSLKRLIILSQKSHFAQEITDLKNNQNVSTSSSMKSLNPFLDGDGILRVGGRILGSEVHYDQKHPILLHNKHPLTKLIVRSEHYKQLHAGANALLATIRLRFWPLSAKGLVRKILHDCVICFRVNPRIGKHIMGNLPETRVTPSRLFYNCGLDYAGPIEIKASNIRNAKRIKAYLCIFICFATKAIHIEVVSDLSTDAFLNCFKRFVSRRGKPKNVFSDKATNLHGANNVMVELTEFLKQENVQRRFYNFFAQDQTIWHFIPANSPS